MILELGALVKFIGNAKGAEKVGRKEQRSRLTSQKKIKKTKALSPKRL